MCAICVVWNKQKLTKAELWRAIMETSFEVPASKQTHEFKDHLQGIRDQVESLQGDGLFSNPNQPKKS